MTSEVAPRTAVTVPQDHELSDAAIEALAAGIPDSTRRAYKSDLRTFATWCAETGRRGLPATSNTLTEYGTHLAYTKHHSPATIERARWAIRKAHETAGLDVPSSKDLAKVIKGYRTHLAVTKDVKARPQRATAADKEALEAMLARLDLTLPSGRRDAALVMLGFAVAARRSELAALDICDVTETAQGILVSVFRIKTGKLQEVAVPHGQDPALCAVVATTRWISTLAECGRITGPLFVRINRHQQIGPRVNRDSRPIGDATGRMTAQAVGQVIGRKARAAALGGKYTGHSLRRGLATEARKAGHDQIRIARQGGWDDNSQVLARYIEDADRWTDNALKGVL
jgi:site-specific recombinase XerD